MKLCGKCGLEKELEEFYKNKRKPDGRQDQCKSCQRQYHKGWYNENAIRHKKMVANRRKENKPEIRQKYYDYLAARSCIDCGESDPVILDFDHVRGKKRYNVSRMIGGGWSWDAILKEIKNCEIRCANCHRRKTAVQFGYYKDIKK